MNVAQRRSVNVAQRQSALISIVAMYNARHAAAGERARLQRGIGE